MWNKIVCLWSKRADTWWKHLLIYGKESNNSLVVVYRLYTKNIYWNILRYGVHPGFSMPESSGIIKYIESNKIVFFFNLKIFLFRFSMRILIFFKSTRKLLIPDTKTECLCYFDDEYFSLKTYSKYMSKANKTIYKIKLK